MLYINKLAAIFCPQIDLQNNWETIVFNPQSQELFKINKIGYFILKKIHDNPGIKKEELSQTDLSAFIDQMIQESIILEKR